nr:hypothetical protein [Bradyrhizobium sp. CCBAU 53421]
MSPQLFPHHRPCESVWSRLIGKGLDWRLVAEAFEAGSVVVVDELAEEGVPIGVVDEGAAGAAALFFATYGFGDAPVEAFDEAVGLRVVGLGQAMLDAALLAELIKGVVAGRSPGRLVLLVDGEAVGELGAVVGQDGVNVVREVGQEALKETGRGGAVPPGMDLDKDVAGGAVDGDKGVAGAALQGRQILHVDMDEADTGILEDAGLGPVRLGKPADAIALQAAVNGAAGQLGIDAAPHHLDDVVERQLQRRPQLAHRPLFDGRQAGHEVVRPVRAVLDRGAAAPAIDRGLADPEFGRQFGDRLLAALDVGTRLRRRRGVRVQVQFHDTRRSLTKATPRSTPIPSNQSAGIKHESRDDTEYVARPLKLRTGE